MTFAGGAPEVSVGVVRREPGRGWQLGVEPILISKAGPGREVARPGAELVTNGWWAYVDVLFP